jgi:hypothetical protein
MESMESQEAGRAIIPLVAPLGLLIYGFWVSLGGQPILGNALREESRWRGRAVVNLKTAYYRIADETRRVC